MNEDALVELGTLLRKEGYRFITVTPETHRRVLSRSQSPARSVRDVFGWSRPFDASALGRDKFALLEAAGALEPVERNSVSDGRGLFRSTVRFSSLGERLLLHSAYPTGGGDSVFFGPDTYRFCSAITRAGASAPTRWRRVFDIGCGSGAGGLVASDCADEVVLGDINPRALACARVNARMAGVRAAVVESDVMSGAEGTFDLILANPPYMKDEHGRTYRDGGGQYGEALALRMLREGLERLRPRGLFLLYTGAPIVDGDDMFFRHAREVLDARGIAFRYEELDPDVFGEELEQPGYAAVDRIAAVVLSAHS